MHRGLWRGLRLESHATFAVLEAGTSSPSRISISVAKAVGDQAENRAAEDDVADSIGNAALAPGNREQDDIPQDHQSQDDKDVLHENSIAEH